MAKKGVNGSLEECVSVEVFSELVAELKSFKECLSVSVKKLGNRLSDVSREVSMLRTDLEGFQSNITSQIHLITGDVDVIRNSYVDLNIAQGVIDGKIRRLEKRFNDARSTPLPMEEDDS